MYFAVRLYALYALKKVAKTNYEKSLAVNGHSLLIFSFPARFVLSSSAFVVAGLFPSSVMASSLYCGANTSVFVVLHIYTQIKKL